MSASIGGNVIAVSPAHNGPVTPEDYDAARSSHVPAQHDGRREFERVDQVVNDGRRGERGQSFMSLRSRILLLVTFATLIPAAMFGLLMLESRESQVRESTLHLAALAAYGAQDLNNTVSGTVQLLHGLSRAADLATDNKTACSAFLAEVLARYPQYTGLLTITPDGQLHCDSLRSGRTLDLNDRKYFQQARVASGPVLEPVFGRLTGMAVLQVAYPVRNAQGALAFVILASLNLEKFAESLATAGAPSQMSVLIWDQKGMLLARQPDVGAKLAGKAFPQSPLFEFVSTAAAGSTAELPSLGDDNVRVWALGIPSFASTGGLRIALGTPRQILLAQADRELQQAIAMIAIVSLAAFLAALVFAELGIRRHLTRISVAAARQRAGEFDAQIGGVYPRDELGDVMEALDSTAAAVQAQQAKIESQSQELVRTNRTLRMVSAVKSAIVRLHERDALLAEACRIAAVDGGFPLVWAGVIDAGSKQITPVAWYGADLSPAARDVTWARAWSEAFDTLMNESNAVVVTDSDKRFSALSTTGAPNRNSRALAAFPLRISGVVGGVFVLHAEAPDRFDESETTFLGAVVDDVAFGLEHMQTSAKLAYLAQYDPLTGFANRSLFQERLRHYIATAASGGRPLYLVMANIDRFHRVNDTFGRGAGDELLRQISSRAATQVGGPEHLARIGVDLFGCMITGVTDAASVGRKLERAHHAILDEPFTVAGAEVRVSVRYGIAVYPTDGHDAESLIRNAEAAMKRAKGGGERFLFYESAMSEQLAEKLALENKLRMALSREEFVLHYRPTVDAGTRRIVGVEALLRWQSPDLGLMLPHDFMPLLEETGLIVEVGNWVLRQAVHNQREWRDAGCNPPRIAVNVSPVQLNRRDFVQSVESVLREASASTAIDLEVTESSVMDNVEDNLRKLVAIHEMGVDIAIDGFGTGQSSLAYLTRLPVKALKIDHSLVVAFLTDRHIMTMVSTIISLAHSLRLTVIAEGVDTEEQAKTLHLLRCDQMQGSFCGNPLPKAELLALLQAAPGTIEGQRNRTPGTP